MRKVRKNRFFSILLLVLFLIFAINKAPDIIKIIYPMYYEDTINKYSKGYEIDPLMIASVIKTESNFNPYARSKKGAIGLMQITPKTGQWIATKLKYEDFNEDMLYESDINIKFGCWYIDYLSKKYEYNFKLVFCAYNGGLGNVDKWISENTITKDPTYFEDIPYIETKNYLKKIKNSYTIYKLLYKNLNQSGE